MSLPRIIYEGDTFYHVLNRVGGEKDYFPIDDTVKQKFLDIMNHLLELHDHHTKIISYAVMDNHYHLVLSHDRDKELSEEEVRRSFYRYYSSEKTAVEWNEESYTKTLKRMQSLSMFIGELERRLTLWYNQTYHRQKYGKIRRGHLWQSRYKSCVIDASVGLRKCVAYVECNPLRAGIVDNPSEYNFSSWGNLKGSGKHPYAENFTNYFLEDEYDNPLTAAEKFKRSIKLLENTIINKMQIERHLTDMERDELMKTNPFEVVSRRVRYWGDAGVIFCKMQQSKLEENIYDKKIKSHKVIHQFKDSLGNIMQPLSWHKIDPLPDS